MAGLSQLTNGNGAFINGEDHAIPISMDLEETKSEILLLTGFSIVSRI